MMTVAFKPRSDFFTLTREVMKAGGDLAERVRSREKPPGGEPPAGGGGGGEPPSGPDSSQSNRPESDVDYTHLHVLRGAADPYKKIPGALESGLSPSDLRAVHAHAPGLSHDEFSKTVAPVLGASGQDKSEAIHRMIEAVGKHPNRYDGRPAVDGLVKLPGYVYDGKHDSTKLHQKFLADRGMAHTEVMLGGSPDSGALVSGPKAPFTLKDIHSLRVAYPHLDDEDVMGKFLPHLGKFFSMAHKTYTENTPNAKNTKKSRLETLYRLANNASHIILGQKSQEQPTPSWVGWREYGGGKTPGAAAEAKPEGEKPAEAKPEGEKPAETAVNTDDFDLSDLHDDLISAADERAASAGGGETGDEGEGSLTTDQAPSPESSAPGQPNAGAPQLDMLVSLFNQALGQRGTGGGQSGRRYSNRGGGGGYSAPTINMETVRDLLKQLVASQQPNEASRPMPTPDVPTPSKQVQAQARTPAPQLSDAQAPADQGEQAAEAPESTAEAGNAEAGDAEAAAPGDGGKEKSSLLKKLLDMFRSLMGKREKPPAKPGPLMNQGGEEAGAPDKDWAAELPPPTFDGGDAQKALEELSASHPLAPPAGPGQSGGSTRGADALQELLNSPDFRGAATLPGKPSPSWYTDSYFRPQSGDARNVVADFLNNASPSDISEFLQKVPAMGGETGLAASGGMSQADQVRQLISGIRGKTALTRVSELMNPPTPLPPQAQAPGVQPSVDDRLRAAADAGRVNVDSLLSKRALANQAAKILAYGDKARTITDRAKVKEAALAELKARLMARNPGGNV